MERKVCLQRKSQNVPLRGGSAMFLQKHLGLDETIIFCQENSFVTKYQPMGDGMWQESSITAMPRRSHCSEPTIRYQDLAALKACWRITPIPQSLPWLQKILPSNSCVSELTFKMLGGYGWQQNSSLITFQHVARHELVHSLIQCGQIARVIFCPQTRVFWTSSLPETYPRRALNKRDFFQFSGFAMTSSCLLGADQKFNGKK